MTATFSPPPYCFTSPWATNPILEGLVYVTVGCPAIDVSTAAPPSLTACCGPFSDMTGFLLATLTGCPEGYGAVSSYIRTGLGSYDFATWECCPTLTCSGLCGWGLNSVYGWTGSCALSASDAFKSGGPATVTVTYANELHVTWTGTGAPAPLTTPGGSSQSNLTPSETQQPSSSTPSTSSNPSQTSSSTSKPASTSQNLSSASESTPTSPNITSSTTSPDANSSNLSAGAKAGIGVGATIGGILLFGLIAYLFFQYGKRTAAKTGSENAPLDKAELGTGYPQPRAAELGGRLRSEMDGTGKAVEIDGSGGAFQKIELAG